MAVGDVTNDPVLIRFRQALRSAYGDRLERAILYGSRARGDARADSDYDVAVFLHGMDNRDPELYRLADLTEQVIEATDKFVHAMPHRAGAYNQRTPLMREIRREGIDL
jgi:predicted nucleotidyltransferase